jgi:preprotein translocase subunit SecE
MPGALEKIQAWPRATKDYFGELQNEMKKVTWPNRQQVQATTAVVILTVFAFAAYFKVIDTLLDRSMDRFYQLMTK